MKAVGGVALGLALVLCCTGAGLFAYLGNLVEANAAEEAIDDTAATIAHEVDRSLADRSPGDFSTAGVSRLKSAIENRDGEVLGSFSTYTIELGELQGWVDARFSDTAPGGLSGQSQQSATLCQRFEVRWTYDDYVTHHHVDCP